MEPITGIMLIVKVVESLAPVLLPRIISIARDVKGLTTGDIMTLDEFDKAISDRQEIIASRKWEDPV
ncbi:MAG TPA: hypothetical protein VJ455_00325 [Ignavibacteria bacterium]|nr:hypothetical protein [Ignavibacteria bacterium]